MSDVSEEIKIIKERNTRVEMDKAWEISFTRRMSIAFLTYLLIVLFLFVIGVAKPWLNAVVPVVGFLLSTLSLGLVKKKWIKRRLK